jgi:dTDP-4-dehydrorhamnose reductase
MVWRRRFRRPLLVTGASGFLGRHLVDAPGDWEVIAPSHAMVDLRHRDRTLEFITGWKPQAIAHLAYRKDRQSIVDASRNVAEAAAACGARLVHLSTDVVFGGRPLPYTEHDEPFPVIEYGRDKLDAERAVFAAAPGAVAVRTSLLYGTERLSPAQVDAQEAAQGRSSMTFFTDEVRCPTHAADVAAAIVALAARPEVAGPLHVSGPRPMSRAEFAEITAAWLGLPPAAVRTSTIEQSGQVRPGHVVLDGARAASLGLRCRDPLEVLGRR